MLNRASEIPSRSSPTVVFDVEDLLQPPSTHLLGYYNEDCSLSDISVATLLRMVFFLDQLAAKSKRRVK